MEGSERIGKEGDQRGRGRGKRGKRGDYYHGTFSPAIAFDWAREGWFFKGEKGKKRRRKFCKKKIREMEWGEEGRCGWELSHFQR